MIKFGRVCAYDETTGTAVIEYIRPDACAKCGACGMLNKKGSIELKADCAVGNWVKVYLPDNRFLSAAAIAYVIPLIGFLGGLFLAYSLSGHNDLWSIAGGLVGLGLCLLVMRLTEKRVQGKPDWTPHVEAVYENKPEMDDIGCQKEE